MTDIVEQALALWGLQGATYTLSAARENLVYRVDKGARSVALRLHRKGYRTNAALRSELAWMAAVAKGGLSVPSPVLSKTGMTLHLVNGTQVDVLTWLSGVPLNEKIKAFPTSQRAAMFHQIGRQMARLHDLSDQWPLPKGFTRDSWDREGLVGEAPLWDRFWENPFLTPDQQRTFLAFREKAQHRLSKCGATLDYGLIHADLVSQNLMIDAETLHLIDFDDGGFGFRLFDVATSLLKFMSDADYPALRDALLTGYHQVRPLDIDELNLFLALRACTYVGWNITRMSEEGGATRNARFIDTAHRLARGYIEKS